MPRIVHLNGAYLPEAEAKVSVFDRGYLFADGVYEVTAVIDGRLVDYEPHMERLDRSLRELAMAWPCTKEELRAVHAELLARNDLSEGRVYMQVTRGVAERDFAYPKDVPTTLLAFTQAAALVDNPKAETGVEAISIPDIRWRRRDIKSIALLHAWARSGRLRPAPTRPGWWRRDT
jgi:D-alanine transaminase